MYRQSIAFGEVSGGACSEARGLPMTGGAAERERLRRMTAPGLLVERARRDPAVVAYRAKKRGIYRERTWRDYAAMTARVALGLKRLGLKPGERVAIMGDACEEWLLCDLGAQAAGGITYGIYPTAATSEVEHQMRDGAAAIFIAENQEYVDKILPVADRLDNLRAIVVIDASAMFAYDHPKLRKYDDILPDLLDGEAVDALDAMAQALDPAAPSFIVYTSGTTGAPKGAVALHGRHLAATQSMLEIYPMLRDPQRSVVYLPLCHILGRIISNTLPLMSGVVPHFGENLTVLPRTFYEVAPTVMFTVPRYLQKFAAQILVGITNSSPAKRAAYRLAMAVGRHHSRNRWDGKTEPLVGALYQLLHLVALRPILAQIGFADLRLVASGGAPLSGETMALWQIYGVNTLELYGQTEAGGGIITGQRGPFPRPGDVGTVPDGWEVRLSEDGEVLVYSPDLFVGYWNQPEATRAVLDDGGWLHTGDIGEFVDGRLKLVDRARDFICTEGGKTLSPTAIENALRASPYISEAVVIGDRRKYVTALIEIDFETVSEWARAQSVPYTGFTTLIARKEIHELLRGEIARANHNLARVEQVKDFRILPKVLDPEVEGEPMTPTRKVKRKQMEERFRELIDSMYDDSEARRIASEAGRVLAG
jgi:long-chain acyl-CoA synthetase